MHNTSEEYFYSVIKAVMKINESDYGVAPLEQKQKFIALAQNKFLLAVCGFTTSELIITHANAKSPDMGLKRFTGAVPTLSDAILGKNYLDEMHFTEFELLVDNFLGFCRLKTIRKRYMNFDELTYKLSCFLELYDYTVLYNNNVQLEKEANLHVREEFRKFTVTK